MCRVKHGNASDPTKGSSSNSMAYSVLNWLHGELCHGTEATSACVGSHMPSQRITTYCIWCRIILRSQITIVPTPTLPSP